MWVETDGGPVLGLHLGMAGQIVVDEPPIERPWDRFVLEFEDGGRLALRDRRRLGRAVLEPELSRVGPDAATVGRRSFRDRVGRGAAPVKARIMDQGTIAGVGNLLADEALWRARLASAPPRGRPVRRGARSACAASCARRSAARVRKGGVHTGAFAQDRGAAGRCPRCGAELERGVVGGRTTYWCPREQVVG